MAAALPVQASVPADAAPARTLRRLTLCATRSAAAVDRVRCTSR